MMQNISKKIIVLIVVFSFVFSPILAKITYAIPVEDFITERNTAIISGSSGVTAANTTAVSTKEFGFDTLAWAVVNMILERIAASTVNWINSGFQGKPAYVTDPEAYFTSIGDNIAGQFIFNNPNLNFLCGPIQAKIRLALTKNYIREPIYQCTLTEVVGNIDGFMDDFSQGGWDGFFELTQKQQNNPIGAYLMAENDLNFRIASRQETKEKELNWGQGFMSFKTCKRWGVPSTTTDGKPPPLGSYIDIDPATGQQVTVNSPVGTPTDASGNRVCLEEETSTPGSVISDQLNNVLNTGNNKLAAADEINEIVSALLNQLIGKVVGGIGSGLRGLSGSDSSSGNTVFTGKLTNKPGELTGYFCFDDPENDPNPNVCDNPDAPNTEIFKIPIPNPEGDPSSMWPMCDPSNARYNPLDPICN